MKVLVIGNGAREHVLIWKIAQSNKVSKIYCAPGNGGISGLAECVNIRVDDINTLLNFAVKEKIDLTVVGPEAPLVDGIVDIFKENGLKIFGPNKKGALLEGSKVYSKEFMMRYNIPTARYQSYTNGEDAKNGLKQFKYPLVIKADGLAAGKGVIICNDSSQANNAISEIMNNKKFGEAGNVIVIEEFLEGTEISLLCLVDGKSIIPMESAKDYKKAFDNDEGLNTGGMGCFSPNIILNDKLKQKIKVEILDRIQIGFEKEAIDFRGILFIGLMIDKDEVKVLEFNVRMGDPEAQVVIPRFESDIIDIFEKVIDGTLKQSDLKWTQKQSLTVVVASGGYPERYEKNKLITGLDKLDENVIVFHGGTRRKDEKIFTNGGRVLSVTALAETIEEARKIVYENIERIDFENMYYRKDIGKIF